MFQQQIQILIAQNFHTALESSANRLQTAELFTQMHSKQSFRVKANDSQTRRPLVKDLG